MAQTPPAIPNIDQVERIYISSPRGWVLELYPDGSGKLTYGSTFGDDAKIPANTVSFQDVYNLLVPRLIGNYPGEKAINVLLFVKGGSLSKHPTAFYLEDKATIKKIMSEARDKAVPRSPDRFKELLKNHSPVPDDPTNNSGK